MAAASLQPPVAGETMTVPFEEFHHLLLPGVKNGEFVQKGQVAG
jgi:hypothetical protein